MNKQTTKWIILFCLLMGAFYWLDQSEWFHEVVLSSLSRLIAHVTAGVLSFLGLHVKVANEAVITTSGRFEIANSCNQTLQKTYHTLHGRWIHRSHMDYA